MSGVKKALRRMAPQPLWQFASRAKGRARRRTLDRFVQSTTSGRVAAGPFTGLKLPEKGSWGSLWPLLLGSYELEIHDWVELVIGTNPHSIANIGCAEGYYAVGMARRAPDATVFAFDIDPAGRSACLTTASLNDVADRVRVLAECTPSFLQEILKPGDLVVSDCEGAELAILDPSQAPVLHDCWLLVELHDFVDRSIKPVLLSRFENSHEVELRSSQVRCADDFPILSRLRASLRDSAVNEGRPTDPYPMEWALLAPRSIARDIIPAPG